VSPIFGPTFNSRNIVLQLAFASFFSGDNHPVPLLVHCVPGTQQGPSLSARRHAAIRLMIENSPALLQMEMMGSASWQTEGHFFLSLGVVDSWVRS